MNTRLSPLAIILLAGLLGVAFALSIVNLNVALPYAQWRQALWQPDVDDIAQMLFQFVTETGCCAAGGRRAGTGWRPVPAGAA